MVCKSHHGVTHWFEVSILKFYILEPKVTMLDEGVKKKIQESLVSKFKRRTFK